MPGSMKQDLIDHIIGGALDQTVFMKNLNTDADKIINDAIQLKDKDNKPMLETIQAEEKTVNKPTATISPPVSPKLPMNASPVKSPSPTPSPSPSPTPNKINQNKEAYDNKMAAVAAEKGRKQAEVNAKAAQMDSKLGRLVFLVSQNFGTIHLILVFIAIIALICSFLASILFIVSGSNMMKISLSLINFIMGLFHQFHHQKRITNS